MTYFVILTNNQYKHIVGKIPNLKIKSKLQFK